VEYQLQTANTSMFSVASTTQSEAIVITNNLLKHCHHFALNDWNSDNEADRSLAEMLVKMHVCTSSEQKEIQGACESPRNLGREL